MSTPPTVQVLDRADYTKQHIIALPDALPYPRLSPSSIRVQSRVVSLTTNNLTYARMGHLLGWWDVHPLPSSTPDPYNDAQKYGRISAWGYGEIIESTVPELPVGKTLFGYLPIGTLPEDLTVEVSGSKKDLVRVNNHYRQHLWVIYNRYQVCRPLPELEHEAGARDSLGWDSLMQVLFGTSYNLNAYGLAWEPRKLVHPGDPNLPWSESDADLTDSTVIILSASGKTALAFAHQLRQNRPKSHQPKTLLGVCSAKSQSFVQGTKFYDGVLLYSDTEAATSHVLSTQAKKVMILDFGARENAVPQWHSALSSLAIPLQFLGIGGEVKSWSQEEIGKYFEQNKALNRVQVSASTLREFASALGGEKYFVEFYAAWEGFKASGAIPGVNLKWEEGMEAWEKAWDALSKDQVEADTGLLFTL